MAAQAVGHSRVQAGDWASRICCGCVWRQQMLEGARVLRRPGHVGLTAAVAHCVSLQAACREVQAVAGQRLFCVEFLDPGTGAGRSLSECTAAGGLW